MENKYFTPDIENIRVGYECECLWLKPEPRTWNKIKITEANTETYLELSVEDVINRTKTGEIRVAYLTKEQIEAEGWKFWQTNRICNWYKREMFDWSDKARDFYGYVIYGMTLLHDPEKNKIKIWFDFTGGTPEDSCMFEGECKDINTFRTICKLLNIK
jgi:hypothetical protein